MTEKHLSTESYKGVRDFYPEDMAVQRYIFDTWSKTAESFGFERYDASILESADLYKAKGAENEEMVNEQTYTFIDRGEREVTLRPEMTPTVARMVAGRRRELSFPVRWYSIPNLFRYERPQRGRLREHWQLNCDIFGADHYTADVEIIALAHQLLLDFEAKPEMFEIRVNHRGFLNDFLARNGITDEGQVRAVTSVIDRKAKVTPEEFTTQLEAAAGKPLVLPQAVPDEVRQVIDGLIALGVTNAQYDPAIVRGFSYYTGTVFEIFDVSGENNRSMIGGGRYNNLTSLFGGEPVSGVGFGMGDVTMRDFLETHALLPETLSVTSPEVLVIPTDPERNLDAQALSATLRRATTARITTDISTKKLGKKIGDASDRGVRYVIVVGEEEIQSKTYTIKDLRSGEETPGALAIIESVIRGR